MRIARQMKARYCGSVESSTGPSLIAVPRRSIKACSQVPQQRRVVTARATGEKEKKGNANQGHGLGDLLGPIGLTVGGDLKKREMKEKGSAEEGSGLGDLLGPIGLSVGENIKDRSSASGTGEVQQAKSIHSMTTEEWRAKYEKDGTVDVWVEEEFNAGSRLIGGRDVHKGGVYGIMTGEGPSRGEVQTHKVTITNHFVDQVVEVQVPEDRYILWEAEDEGLVLPYACRMGCCTACAVKIKEGEMWQPEALGVSRELREQGYGLMCVGFPLTDLVLETVPEDEVYDLQFGRVFAEAALDPTNSDYVKRDDFALEVANMDE